MGKCAKRRFRSEVDALIVLARIQAADSPRREKTERRAYPCPKCCGWHLTSRR